MKRIYTLVLWVVSLNGFSQGRTLLYTGNAWRQINVASGQTADNRPPTSVDDVVISQSLSGLTDAYIPTIPGQPLKIGGDSTSFCRSMHISHTIVNFYDSALIDGGASVNVYTSNGGYVLIDSGSVIEMGIFYLFGGNPSIKDLQVEDSKFGDRMQHNADWVDLLLQDSGFASFKRSSFRGFVLATKQHGSTGGLYADNSTFSVSSFILGDNTIDTFLNSSIVGDYSNYGLDFLIGRNAHFVSENDSIKLYNGTELLNFTSSGSVFNGSINSWYINFKQEDPANPLPNIINGDIVMREEPGAGISGNVAISGNLTNYMPSFGFSDYSSGLFLDSQYVFRIGGIKNFGNDVFIKNCMFNFCHYKIEFFGDKNSNIDWNLGFPADTLVINKTNCAKVTSKNALYVAGETRIESGQLSLDPVDTIPYKFVCAGNVKISQGGGLFLRRDPKGTVANIAIKGILVDQNTHVDSSCAGLSNPYNGKIYFYKNTTNTGNMDSTSTGNTDTTSTGNTDTTSTGNSDTVQIVHTDSLTHFSGSYSDKSVILLWTMEKQSKTKYFTIEKSFDQSMFSPVTNVITSPDSPIQNDYQYVDNTSLKNVNYYRLKIADINDHYYYSDTISVVGPDEKIILLYPNPVKDQLFLRLAETSGDAEVSIIDFKGAIIKKIKVTATGDITINTSQLQRGTYSIFIHTGQIEKTIRFIKE
jgi:hypothetical protein